MSSLAIEASDAMFGSTRTSTQRIIRRMAFIVGGVLLVAAAAQVRVPLPFTPVPITGQTFAVLLVGAALGAVDGASSLVLYLVAAAVGAPFFAGASHGVSTLTGPTGGYLVGFVVAAGLVGWLSERGWDRGFGTSVAALLTGSVVIYLLGLLWLARAMDASPLNQSVLLAGLYPFVIGDVVKVYAAAVLLPGAWRLVARSR